MWKAGGISVNQEGFRFANENDADVVARETALEEQTNAIQYDIFTDKIIEDTEALNASVFWNFYYAPGKPYNSAVVSADSLAVLAEKLETVVSRATTNTRMRDFYDLHILSQLHGQSIVPADLRAALIATAKKRGTEKYLADAPAAFDEVEADPNMEKLWRAYQKKFSYAADLSWHTVMESIRSLYELARE